jgi:ATP-dependent DNA helicase DinG
LVFKVGFFISFAMIKGDTSFDVRDVLSAGGAVSQCLAGFEERAEQVQMACAIQKAFLKGGHLAVEAGTGVGKSFAYLAPAIELVLGRAGRVLVSTFTITLQEQLIGKDIPLLAESLSGVGGDFTSVLAKGRGNYLCRRRLEFALRRRKDLFDESGSELSAISDWAGRTKDGSLSDMSFMPTGRTWELVRQEMSVFRRLFLPSCKTSAGKRRHHSG